MMSTDPQSHKGGLRAMILDALAAKSRAIGTRYSMRDLATDTDMDIAHVSRIARGKRPATPEILTAWSRALDPYFPLDEALVEAGYVPADPRARDTLRRLVELPRAARDRVFDQLGRIIVEIEEAPNGAGDASGGTTRERQPR